MILGDGGLADEGSTEDGVIPLEDGQQMMNHRFAIFPAGSVASIDQANDLIHLMGADIRGEPSTPIRELIDELSESVEWTFALTRSADSRGVMIATHRPEDGLLRSLLLSTMASGLVVYDIELFRLYDPSARVDIDVSLPGGLNLPYLTPALLRDLVLRPTWPEPEHPYFIVVRADGVFIQAYRLEDGEYQFEHCDGGPHAQFAFRTPDSGLVADVMWAWTTRDESWRTAVSWTQMEFDEEVDEGEDADEVANYDIYVDSNSDRELTFEDTEGEPFLAYHASNGDNEKDADGRLMATGWVLHIAENESFVTGVGDFDSLAEALARATEYLGTPVPETGTPDDDVENAPSDDSTDNYRQVPTFGRGVRIYDGVLTGDPVSGEDHKLTVYAQLSEDGFELNTHDGGHWPVDELHSALWVEPRHVPDLLQALGGHAGDDPVEVFAQQIESGLIPVKTGISIERVCISDWFREKGVPFTYASKNVSNL